MNHSLEGPSISTIVVEQEPHGIIQEAKRRFSLGDVSNPTSSQSDKLPFQDEAHEEAVYMEPIVDVGLPPSNYQEESEGQQVATETPERIVDALDDRNPTPLTPLETWGLHLVNLSHSTYDRGILKNTLNFQIYCPNLFLLKPPPNT